MEMLFESIFVAFKSACTEEIDFEGEFYMKML